MSFLLRTCCSSRVSLAARGISHEFGERSGGWEIFPTNSNVIVEIPMHGDPVKYEIDKASEAIVVERFMSTAMRYSCNYGYIPRTLSADGDPADVFVIAPFPPQTGVVVVCRAVGLLAMEGENGQLRRDARRRAGGALKSRHRADR
jgi:hypothetical protein